jgi:hypothetical protein
VHTYRQLILYIFSGHVGLSRVNLKIKNGVPLFIPVPCYLCRLCLSSLLGILRLYRRKSEALWWLLVCLAWLNLAHRGLNHHLARALKLKWIVLCNWRTRCRNIFWFLQRQSFIHLFEWVRRLELLSWQGKRNKGLLFLYWHARILWEHLLGISKPAKMVARCFARTYVWLSGYHCCRLIHKLWAWGLYEGWLQPGLNVLLAVDISHLGTDVLRIVQDRWTGNVIHLNWLNSVRNIWWAYVSSDVVMRQ